MIRALHELFSEFWDSLWIGIMFGVRISVAAVVVYWCLKGMTGWASMLKAVVQ